MDRMLLLRGDGVAGGYFLNHVIAPPHNDGNLGVSVLHFSGGFLEAVQHPLVPHPLFPALDDLLPEVIHAHTRLLLALAVPLHELFRVLIEVAFQLKILQLLNLPLLQLLSQLLHH